MTSLGVTTLGDLPNEIHLRILEFLRLRDRRRALASLRSLWSLRKEFEAKFSCLTVPTHESRPRQAVSARFLPSSGDEGGGEENDMGGRGVLTARPQIDVQRYPGGAASFFGTLGNLVELDMGGLATDDVFEALAGVNSSVELIKNLRHISMVGSLDVTDRGLELLSRGNNRAQNVISIDITFCRSTTYSGTFPLRDRLHNLALIRRQPEWLDGSFVTPFKRADDQNNGDDELHIYWADGSFQFNRGLQSEGFVVDLFPLEEDVTPMSQSNPGRKLEEEGPRHLADRLQYTNFEPPQSWPGWARYCYRPGVSLLRLPGCEGAESDALADEIAERDSNIAGNRSVLVAQRLEGLRAPLDAPDAYKHTIDVIPLGKSRTFSRDGEIIADSGNGIGDAARHPEGHTLISRMKVLPLPDGGKLMPPSEIVQRNRVFCDETRRAAEDREGALNFFYEQAATVQQSALLFNANGLSEISPAGKVDPLSAALDFGENMLHSALLGRRSS